MGFVFNSCFLFLKIVDYNNFLLILNKEKLRDYIRNVDGLVWFDIIWV